MKPERDEIARVPYNSVIKFETYQIELNPERPFLAGTKLHVYLTADRFDETLHMTIEFAFLNVTRHVPNMQWMLWNGYKTHLLKYCKRCAIPGRYSSHKQISRLSLVKLRLSPNVTQTSPSPVANVIGFLLNYSNESAPSGCNAASATCRHRFRPRGIRLNN